MPWLGGTRSHGCDPIIRRVRAPSARQRLPRSAIKKSRAQRKNGGPGGGAPWYRRDRPLSHRAPSFGRRSCPRDRTCPMPGLVDKEYCRRCTVHFTARRQFFAQHRKYKWTRRRSARPILAAPPRPTTGAAVLATRMALTHVDACARWRRKTGGSGLLAAIWSPADCRLVARADWWRVRPR